MRTRNFDSPRYAYIAIVVYATIVGLSFLFVKLALQAADPLDTLAHRFTVAAAAASAPLLFGWRPRIRAKDLPGLLPLACFYPALFFAFQAYGLQTTTSSEAGIVHATVPIFTMLAAAVYLKERATLTRVLFTLLSVAGVVYIFAIKGASFAAADGRGLLLILLSALSAAAYNAGARKKSRQIPLADMTYVMTVIGFLAFNAIAIVRHGSEGTLGDYFKPFGNVEFALAMAYLGILSSLVTSFLSNFALSKLEAAKVGVFNHLSTLVSIAGGVVFMGDRLHYYHWIGAALIVLGILGANRRKPLAAKRAKEQAAEG